MKDDERSSFDQLVNQERAPIPMPFQPSTSQEPDVEGTPPRRRNRKLIIGIIAALVIILSAGSVFAYTFLYQNPEKVVSDGIMNALKAKTVTFTGSADIASKVANVKLEINGVADKIKGSVNVKATFDTPGQPTTLSGDGLMDSEGNIYIKVKNINDVLKTYRATIPVDSQAVFDRLIVKIDDRWVKISSTDMKQFSVDLGKSQKCVNDTFKKFQNDKAATDEIANIYKKNKFLTIEQNLGSKNGSLGYMIKSNNEGAKGFVRELKNTRVFKSLQDCGSSIAFNEDDITKTDKKINNETRMELWVNQWSHEITRFSTKDETGPERSTFVLEPTFNKTVNITPPEKSITIKELQAEIEILMQSVYAGMIRK